MASFQSEKVTLPKIYRFSILTKKKYSNKCPVMQQLHYFCSIIWNENVTLRSQDTLRISGSASQTRCILKNALSKNSLQSMSIATKKTWTCHCYWCDTCLTASVSSFLHSTCIQEDSSSLILIYFAAGLITANTNGILVFMTGTI